MVGAVAVEVGGVVVVGTGVVTVVVPLPLVVVGGVPEPVVLVGWDPDPEPDPEPWPEPLLPEEFTWVPLFGPRTPPEPPPEPDWPESVVESVWLWVRPGGGVGLVLPGTVVAGPGLALVVASACVTFAFAA